MRAAVYLRVSTLNGQSTENQRLDLEAVAERHGWPVAEVFEDAGFSGAGGAKWARNRMKFRKGESGNPGGRIEPYEARARLERARAIRRALRRLTGRRA